MAELSTVYRRAAELIETRGWRQGSAGRLDAGDRVCLMDAVVIALGGPGLSPAGWNGEVEAAWGRLRDILARRGENRTPVLWNDVPWRRKGEVLALLHEAAEEADRG